MRGYSTKDRALYWLFSDKIPVTKLLIVSHIVTALALALFNGAGIILGYTAFIPAIAASRLWTVITHAFVSDCRSPMCLLFLLFGCFWLWMAGGSLERSWGTRRFAMFFLVMSVFTALGVYAGARITHAPTILSGLWMPLAGITMAFAMLDPEQEIMLWGIVPTKLKYLALLDIVMVLVSYGGNLILGVCALAGMAYSYWYVRGRGFSRPARRRAPRRENVVRVFDKPSLFQRLNPFRRMRDRKTGEWLRKQLDDTDFRDDDAMGR